MQNRYDSQFFHLIHIVLCEMILTFSVLIGAVRAAPPVISVNTLFSDVVISTEYEGWMVKGTGPLALWPQTGLRQAMLAEMNRQKTFILTYPLTEKPVQVSEENNAFFSDLLDVPKDGTFMAFKYLFLPRSVLPPVSQDPGSPHYFYLVKPVPTQAEFQAPPSSDAITLKITNLESNHLQYHEATQLMIAGEQEQGQELMLVCADSGNPEAQFEVGSRFYQQGDFAQAIRYLKLAAEQGNARAQNNYGILHQFGHGTPENVPDLVIALDYFRQAAVQNHPTAQINYAFLLRNGQGTPGNVPDLVTALNTYRQVAGQGIAEGQYIYAMMLQKGEGLPGHVPDLVEALKYFRLAAQQGYVNAQNSYAAMLQSGQGTPENAPDFVTALQYYRFAADQNLSSAQNNYAHMLQKGQGTPENLPDYVTALEYYRRAADQNLAIAQYNYAVMLHSGRGTLSSVPDLVTALEYYCKAADQGHVLAQYNYANINQVGLDAIHYLPNSKLALKYYGLAANQGLAQAQYRYAAMLLEGQGTEDHVPNRETAIIYFQRAATQNHQLAIQALREVNSVTEPVKGSRIHSKNRKRH